MSSKEIEYVKIVSKEKHEFFIEYIAAKQCEGIWDLIKENTHVKERIVSVDLKDYTKDVLEIIIQYLYYKLQNISLGKFTLDDFEIPPNKALGVFKAAINLKI